MPYLMIENPVKVAPSVELMRMLGASASRGQDTKIGQFGSGFPYSLAVLARHGLLEGTKICLGKDVYTFHIVEHSVKDASGRAHTQREIRMKKQNGSSWDLNISTEFGAIDWTDVSLAVREFVSNAIDGCVEFGGTPHKDVVIQTDIPDEGRMTRAKEGFIRIYIPLTSEIQEYVDDLHKYFRCLAPGYDSRRMVFLNTDGGPARVYRKGVLVGSFGEHSLFHYNISNIPINESRIVDSWTARNYCAAAIASCENASIVGKFLSSRLTGQNGRFEDSLYVDTMRLDRLSGTSEQKERIRETFTQAIKQTLGTKVVCNSDIAARIVEGKGYESVRVDGELLSVLREYGAKTADSVLSQDEIEGRIISDSTDAAREMLNVVWAALERCKMTLGKSKPAIRCFTQHTQDGARKGYYRPGDDCIYLRTDHSDGVTSDGLNTVLHECNHYITGANDLSHEFTVFAHKFAVALMLLGEKK